MGPMQQLSLGPILPLHHVSGPYIYTILSKIKKSHNNPKILVTQSFNIVHCNQNTHKPLCAYIQAFWKHFFPVEIDGFFIFCQGELKKQLKISHFVDFEWEKYIKMAWVAHM